MFHNLVFSADALTRHAGTLEQLHAPVATARRIGLLACGSADVDSVLTPLAHTFSTVPGRSVSVATDDRAAGYNADVVLTDLGAFTTVADLIGHASRHHVLCLVTTIDRQEVDPVLALADMVAEHYGVHCLVAGVVSAGTSRRSSRWAKLIARRRPKQMVVMTNPLSHATLAARLLEMSTRTTVLTGAHS